MLRDALSADESQEDGVELTTDEDDSYFAGRSVPLAEHSADVERLARQYAGAVGFPNDLVEDMARAAWLHDVGKADRRFQLMLRGGSEIDLLKDATPWAKSAMAPGDKAAQRLARKRSGYPSGMRHELQSLFMIEKHFEDVCAKAGDASLVQYLVASHHGYCRPFAPVCIDERPVDVTLAVHASDAFGTVRMGPLTSANELYRLDTSLADRFWSLVERYGWMELCWMEAVLRLADHRASELEQDG
jgi:CRISPR-associated endonuclease/helicase Cas3